VVKFALVVQQRTKTDEGKLKAGGDSPNWFKSFFESSSKVRHRI
jgi:hypothetical protein